MKSQQQIIGYFDGACEPFNPGGIASIGVTVYMNGQLIWANSETVFVKNTSESSNQLAEYAGAIRLLTFLIDNGFTDKKIEIRGDSQLVINQLFGSWNIKSGYYFQFALRAKKLVSNFSDLSGRWIPREHNIMADHLATQAFKFFYTNRKRLLT